jgi:hypothetical protein
MSGADKRMAVALCVIWFLIGSLITFGVLGVLNVL